MTNKNMNDSKRHDHPDYLRLANTCPQWWFNTYNMETVGKTRDLLIEKGIIPRSRKNEDVLSSYNNEDLRKLMVIITFEYAQMMITEYEKTCII